MYTIYFIVVLAVLHVLRYVIYLSVSYVIVVRKENKTISMNENHNHNNNNMLSKQSRVYGRFRRRRFSKMSPRSYTIRPRRMRRAFPLHLPRCDRDGGTRINTHAHLIYIRCDVFYRARNMRNIGGGNEWNVLFGFEPDYQFLRDRHVCPGVPTEHGGHETAIFDPPPNTCTNRRFGRRPVSDRFRKTQYNIFNIYYHAFGFMVNVYNRRVCALSLFQREQRRFVYVDFECTLHVA